MRSWVFAAIPLVLAGVIAGEYLNAPAPDSNRALLASLQRDLRFAYHDCVPLGWSPVPVHGTYYPGYTASMQNYGEWLDALWRGRIARTDLRGAQARAVFSVLNRLAWHGLLSRKDYPGRFDYFMTPAALPYYYGSSEFRDNRDSLPYLCYSTIVPQRVNWVTRSTASHWYNVQFTWKPNAPPRWATDGLIRAHSVILPPLTSPTDARVAYRDGEWSVENIYDRGWMMPALNTAAR